MKKLALTLAIIVLVVLALPFGFGWYAERELRAQLDQPGIAALVDVSVKEYDRGWFKSKAVMQIGLAESYIQQLAALQGPAGAEAGVAALSTVKYDSDLDITHGPVLWAKGLRFGLVEWTTAVDVASPELKALLDKAGADKIFTSDLYIDFAQVTHFSGTTPALKWTDDSGEFDIEPFSLDGKYVPTTRQFTMTGGMPALSIKTEEAEAKMGAATMGGTFRFISEVLYVGDFSFGIDKFEVKPLQSGASPVALGGLKVTSAITQSADEKSLNIGVTYAADRVSSAEFDIADAVLNVELNSLDREFLEAYAGLYRDPVMLQKLGTPEGFSELSGLFYKLISGSPEFAIKPLAFKLNGESSKLELEVKADGSGVTSPDQVSIDQLPALREIVNATATLEVGRNAVLAIAKNRMKNQIKASMLRSGQEMSDEQIEQIAEQQAPRMFEQFVAQGFVEQTPTGFKTIATVKKGQVAINGNPMPF